MHVLHLTRDFPPRARGGLSTAVAGMVDAQARQAPPAPLESSAGPLATVVSFDGFRPLREQQAAVIALPAPQSRGPVRVLRVTRASQLSALRAALRELPFGLVHVHDPMLGPLAVELRGASPHRVRIVASVHVLQRHQNALRGLDHSTASADAEVRLLQSSDLVVAPSGSAAEQLRADHPGWQGQLRVCRFGVQPRPQATLAGPPHVVAAGRMSDLKGTGELLAAIARVGSEMPALRFTIAGGVPENRKAERRWLARARRILPADVHARVRFTGWLEPTALHDLLASASVFVAPSWYESFGLGVLEAMAHGLPIAATAAGGVRELIEHGQQGLLCPTRDPHALAAAMLELIIAPQDAHRMGHAARARARSAFAWPRVLPDWLRAYADA